MNDWPPASASPALFALLGIVVTKLVDWGISRGARGDTYADGLRKDIAGLRGELNAKDLRLDALEGDLDELRATYRDREDKLERRIDLLKGHAGQLETRVASLERYIREHGLEVPTWSKGAGTP